MKKRKTANWKHIDSSVRQQLNTWNEPAPVQKSITAWVIWDFLDKPWKWKNMRRVK